MEESVGLLRQIKESFGLKEVDIRTYSPLTLAYIGDAVYDVIFRTAVVSQGNAPVNKLHHKTIQYVKAPAQAALIESIMDELTPEEEAVYKRGRNAKSISPAKNQSITDYRRATGFEALMGYLYLKKEWKRMLDLVKIGLDSLESV